MAQAAKNAIRGVFCSASFASQNVAESLWGNIHVARHPCRCSSACKQASSFASQNVAESLWGGVLAGLPKNLLFLCKPLDRIAHYAYIWDMKFREIERILLNKVTIPYHTKDIAPIIITSILRQAGIKKE
jgi:hypothetical protein